MVQSYEKQRNLLTNSPEKMGVANSIGIIIKESHGMVDIEHGANVDGDYIWHFMPKHHSKTFPEDLSKVYQVLVTYLNKIIPESIKVDVYPPPKDWEIRLLTVVARKIKKSWTYDYDDMKKYLPIIGTKLTELMVKGK